MISTKYRILNAERLFRRFAFLTVLATYLLIVIGGIVRATGSGMGCPDWPKCFGQWVPPTQLSQLPSDYKQHYLDLRLKKNIRVAKMLYSLGFSDAANAISNDQRIYKTEPFVALKTWIEYVNRLFGVLVGLFIFLTVVFSLKVYTTKPRLFWLSLLALISVIFQGWLGSIVVSANLLPFIITLHMLLAFGLVALLIYLHFYSIGKPVWLSKNLLVPHALIPVTFIALGVSILQVVFGTQVREAVDAMVDKGMPTFAGNLVNLLGNVLQLHRAFSVVLLAISGYLSYLMFITFPTNRHVAIWLLLLIGCLVISMISGMIMSSIGIVPLLQPIHLTIGCTISGLYLYLLFALVAKPIADNISTAEGNL